jgi:YfiH family protein
LTLRWDAPAPYEVVFSTRNGGVSEGAFESLNLGALTHDEPANVVENRRRLCASIGADPERATMAYQRHSAEVRRAEATGIVTPGTRFADADGLWTDEPGQPMLLLTADCVPVSIARANGSAPALAVLHVGWRGLLGGIIEAAAGKLAGRKLVAAVGPAIGPCCYEVKEDVAAPFRDRFGGDVLLDGRLDLWSATEQALREAGCETVERFDLCTFCHPGELFSHRRDHGVTGRQGVLGLIA